MKSKTIQFSSIGQSKSFGLELARQITIFVLSFVLSNTKILGVFSPLGIAFTTSMSYNFYYISFVGSLVGYIVLGSITSNISNIIGLCIVFFIKILIKFYKEKLNNANFLSFISFSTVFISHFINLLFTGYSLAALLLILSESFLIGSITYFCSITFKVIQDGRLVSHTNIFEKASITIVGAIILISLCNIQFIFLNLGKIIGIIIVLAIAYKYGFVGGAISGIIVSMSVTLYNPKLIGIASAIAVGAFIAGIFNSFGKLLIVSVFIIINSFSFVLIGTSAHMFISIIDLLLACFIYMAIPERLYEKIFVQTGSMNTFEVSRVNSNISSKLEFASKTISDLQSSVENVSKKIDDMTQIDINNIFQITTESVCKRCGLNMMCWDTNYDDTVNALNKTARLLKVNGRINKFDIPYYFQKQCCKLEDLIGSINKSYKKYISKETTNRRVTEVRNVAIEQFEAMAEMLCEISSEIGEVVRFDDKMAIIVRGIFENNGVIPSQVCCFIDKYGRTCIDVYLDDEFKVDSKILSSQISDVLQHEFDLPSVMAVKGKTKISFFECANFSVDFHAVQISCENGDVCGDTYEYFIDSKGFAHIILSDGMGSGKKAAIDSVMTCSLVLKLIKAGFGFESVIKLINSSLLVKSSDESIATLDIATIDLYTGRLYFNKAGSACSFIFKNNKILKVNSKSLPIGILKGVSFDKKMFTVGDNNIIVMISDGVISTGTEWIESELQLHHKKSAKDIANIICREAKRRSDNDRSDDMTVIVSKIKKTKII